MYSLRSLRPRGRSTLAAAFVLPALLIATRASAWWSTGHMVVAQIAYERLSPRARAECDRLLAIEARPESASFVTCSCWADDLKGMGVHAYDTWHYIDRPFSTDGTRLPAATDPQNVEWAIGQCLQTLGSPRAPDVEKARMLRFLVHFVGDVHQPLHCVSRYTADHADGDAGGNRFPLAGNYRNLHAFWDAGAGMFEDVPRPLNSAGQATITRLAAECTAAYPQDKLSNAADLMVADWVKEGSALAQVQVYKTEPGKAPSQQYIDAAHDTCRRQVALAGCRLAAVLNSVFADAARAPR